MFIGCVRDPWGIHVSGGGGRAGKGSMYRGGGRVGEGIHVLSRGGWAGEGIHVSSRGGWAFEGSMYQVEVGG